MAEGQKLRYVGPSRSVTIPALRTSVPRNHQVTVEDPALAASLLEQADWELVGAKTKTKDETPPAPPTEG